ncbi:hypothetical protein SAMN05216223_11922 [Actinacidiphila yanglinensis]|uniref:Lipoprotein CseA n=1 Tax=Actinacidiphila yanglinensis TaxID=310779 RepID=A0A1H6DU83_9ACTN|nr:hypothetical protein [Actinacidiphila yanglinensis]SEG88256.1 hypothetical protein SAMN05216223_11922 [Actinacidiphila yanglinensis]
MRRIALTAAAGAFACVAAAGCGTTVTGARREGPAPTATVKAPATSAPALAADPAALAGMVRRDTSVSPDVREDLEPCSTAGSAASARADEPDATYPLDTDSGDLTSGDGPDLVVNVTTCGDGIGIASYVYRMTGSKYRCVFADERSPVYGSVIDGRLQVVHEVYRTDDAVAYPAGEESVTYAWRGAHFLQVARSYFDFGAKQPTARPEPTSTEPAPLPKSELLDPELPTNAPGSDPATSPAEPPKTPATTPHAPSPTATASGGAAGGGR